MILVVSGPGGVGKGTVVARLIEAVPDLWLSRSWTTRPRRRGEADDAYVFVDRATFEARIAQDGFLEWAEFLGNLYGTPHPDDADGRDLVLEIDVQGAEQVCSSFDDAILVLLSAPSREELEARLVGRGDEPDKVRERLAVADAEEAKARDLGAHVVVNEDLDETVDAIAAVIEEAREAATGR